ncbi:ornithine cyclodeaminase (plasmid) [Ralstonia solanacearum]|nr:ornithine cyclodeaminase [Ralstonia solanacearum]
MTRLIQEVGLTRLIGELADFIQSDFIRWPEFDKCARVANHSEIGVIELMPVSNAKNYAFKYVNGHPNNTRQGLYTVMAFGVLAEVETGYPVLLSELTLATALRTCATSLMAARALARPDARRMALIGNGAQSEFQALAFHHHLGIEEIAVYDVDPLATEKLVRNLSAWPSLKIVRARSTAEAVRGADIVTTVTADKAYATIITPDMIEPGMHINGVGGDCPGKTELHADVLRGARVFVEYEPQTRIEGTSSSCRPISRWWICGACWPARWRAAERGQVTVFDSVGFALEDYSTLRYVLEQAERRNLGETVQLVPWADDPKDLFSHTRSNAHRATMRRAA